MYYAFLLWFFIPGTAFAYLDPGTGSLLLQGLIGGIAAAFGILSLYWQKFKSWIFRNKNNDDEQ